MVQRASSSSCRRRQSTSPKSWPNRWKPAACRRVRRSTDSVTERTAVTPAEIENGIKILSYIDTSDFPEVGFGLKQKRIVLGDDPNAKNRPLFLITHFPPNAVLPRHYHGDVFVDAVVQGSSKMDGQWFEAGTVRWFPKEAMYGPVEA